MADRDDQSGTVTASIADRDAAGGERGTTKPTTSDSGIPQEGLPEKSGASPAPARPQKSETFSRPVQVSGKYPVRQVTYYQFSTSDIRSIGLAQAAATIFAAIGTFALSSYLDFGKDITLAEEAGQTAPQFLHNVTELSFWAWIVSWVLAALAFVWQRNELSRIKIEHGELTLWRKAGVWWSNRGSG